MPCSKKPCNMPSARSKNKKAVVPLTLLQFDQFGTHILVKVGINRLKGHYFVVDTGASSSVIDSNIKNLKKMALPEEISSFALSEEMMDTNLCIIKKLSIGDVEYDDYLMASLDLSGLKKAYSRFIKLKISGLLGGDFLKMNNAVIDYKKKTMSLEPDDSIPPTFLSSLFGNE